MIPVVSIVISSWPPALVLLLSSSGATQGMTTWMPSIRGSRRDDEPRGGGWGPSREEATL